MAKRKPSPSIDLFHKTPDGPAAPDYLDLFANPEVKSALPTSFSVTVEAEHLRHLWSATPELQRYRFERFVYAGGSGMVFRVRIENGPERALKIVRKRVYDQASDKTGVATRLSPLPPNEIRALEQLSHPNLVHLYDALHDEKGVFAICTSYVQKPMGLDEYLTTVLSKDPGGRKGVHAFSPQRLDNACTFLIERCSEIAAAVAHMHAAGFFHLDIKPANILISSERRAILTDMGSSVHSDQLAGDSDLRVHFTWTYAHPDLTSIVSDPASISGGGLKSSARPRDPNLVKYDLFAFGKSIQEALAILATEFGERCNAAYGYRFLHLIACLLLDGHNAPAAEEAPTRAVSRHGKSFASDVALGYAPGLFAYHKITSAAELVDRLQRFSRQYSWNHVAPELDGWTPSSINAVTQGAAPFTRRVAKIMEHGALRRLKAERQLGWMAEVYPGATHDRWSHTLGVFAALVGYFNALLSDPEVPTVRILLDPSDLSHAFVAALLHDVGQTAFGHDLEEACPYLFKHEDVIERVLDDGAWGKPTLRQRIAEEWPEVDLNRVLVIVRTQEAGTGLDPVPRSAVDSIAADILRGPIDADKLDYLRRDSIACGVPYGRGIDAARFLKSLTVTRGSTNDPTLSLAYKAKGRAAVTSLLLARYQMFGAVYWHHAYRCVQAMFNQAAAMTFGVFEKGGHRTYGLQLALGDVQQLLYRRVICGQPWSSFKVNGRALPSEFLRATPPPGVSAEPMVAFVWRFAPAAARALLERLAARQLYKRGFEMRLGELADVADYSAMRVELDPRSRPQKALALQLYLLDTIGNQMRTRGPSETESESTARGRHAVLSRSETPLVVLDFPTRGIPVEPNTPREIGDAVRKYFVLPKRSESPADNIFAVVKKLHEHMATVRVFMAPELHELVIRYLTRANLQECVAKVINQVPRAKD